MRLIVPNYLQVRAQGSASRYPDQPVTYGMLHEDGGMYEVYPGGWCI